MLNVNQIQTDGILLAKPVKILNRLIITFNNNNNVRGCKQWIDSCPFKPVFLDYSSVITLNSNQQKIIYKSYFWIIKIFMEYEP